MNIYTHIYTHTYTHTHMRVTRIHAHSATSGAWPDYRYEQILLKRTAGNRTEVKTTNQLAHGVRSPQFSSPTRTSKTLEKHQVIKTD